jgi:hypothetical protein
MHSTTSSCSEVSPTPGGNQGRGSNPRGCRGGETARGQARHSGASPSAVQPLRHFVPDADAVGRRYLAHPVSSSSP